MLTASNVPCRNQSPPVSLGSGPTMRLSTELVYPKQARPIHVIVISNRGRDGACADPPFTSGPRSVRAIVQLSQNACWRFAKAPRAYTLYFTQCTREHVTLEFIWCFLVTERSRVHFAHPGERDVCSNPPPEGVFSSISHSFAIDWSFAAACWHSRGR